MQITSQSTQPVEKDAVQVQLELVAVACCSACCSQSTQLVEKDAVQVQLELVAVDFCFDCGILYQWILFYPKSYFLAFAG